MIFLVSHLPSVCLQVSHRQYLQYRLWWFEAGEQSSGEKLSSPPFGVPLTEVWSCIAALDDERSVTVPRVAAGGFKERWWQGMLPAELKTK